jgi:hypothetical protein
MNDTQKEIAVSACRELCASRGEPPCGEVVGVPSWTPCRTCNRIAALATAAHNELRITVQHAVEELHSQIDGGEECRGRDQQISYVIDILEGRIA